MLVWFVNSQVSQMILNSCGEIKKTEITLLTTARGDVSLPCSLVSFDGREFYGRLYFK